MRNLSLDHVAMLEKKAKINMVSVGSEDMFLLTLPANDLPSSRKESTVVADCFAKTDEGKYPNPRIQRKAVNNDKATNSNMPVINARDLVISP